MECKVVIPGQPIFKGKITGKKGDQFLVKVGDEKAIPVPMICVIPILPTTPKPKTGQEEQKKELPNRRKRGEGTGRIDFQYAGKRGGTQYKQAWFHYEVWNGSKLVRKTSVYIPKSSVNEITQMNDERYPVGQILEALAIAKGKGRKNKPN